MDRLRVLTILSLFGIATALGGSAVRVVGLLDDPASAVVLVVLAGFVLAAVAAAIRSRRRARRTETAYW